MNQRVPTCCRDEDYSLGMIYAEKGSIDYGPGEESDTYEFISLRTNGPLTFKQRGTVNECRVSLFVFNGYNTGLTALYRKDESKRMIFRNDKLDEVIPKEWFLTSDALAQIDKNSVTERYV